MMRLCIKDKGSTLERVTLVKGIGGGYIKGSWPTPFCSKISQFSAFFISWVIHFLSLICLECIRVIVEA